MRKIVISGPECTGKTTLSRELSKQLGCPWLPEYSREYLSTTGTEYTYHDLEKIARGHLEREKKLEESCDLFVLDTALLVLKVWSSYRFDKVPNIITEHLTPENYDIFVLCKVDIPWEEDPLRENPHNRGELYDIYKRELHDLALPYIVVDGATDERVEKVLACTFAK